jgi:hypothetical protein
MCGNGIMRLIPAAAAAESSTAWRWTAISAPAGAPYTSRTPWPDQCVLAGERLVTHSPISAGGESKNPQDAVFD